MGRAEELFARIRDRGTPEIYAMIEAQIVEELFLDYKQSSTTLPSTKLSDDDRKNIAKAISGFGNSEGGVIVWGVVCRQTPQGDIPIAPVLISNAVAFKTLLDNVIGGLTLPAHSGVENIYLLDGTGPGGFVVTHILSGTSAPYRALLQGEYYIRAGSTFLPTPHGVLAGLFGHIPQPIAMPVLRYRNTTHGVNAAQQSFIRILLEVHVRNDGRGFAEDIFSVADMIANKSCDFIFRPLKDTHERWRTENEARNSFTIRLTDLTLPPGTERHGFNIEIEILSEDAGTVSLVVTCGSRGGPASATNIEMPSDVVAQVYRQTGIDLPTMHAMHARADEQVKACIGPEKRCAV
jgi:hypothetical protein